MKRMTVIVAVICTAMTVLGVASCKPQSEFDQLQHQLDSLRQAKAAQDEEYSRMTSYLDAITATVDSITAQEQLLSVTLDEDNLSTTQLQRNITRIEEMIATQQEQISKLTKELGKEKSENAKFQSLIKYLNGQLDQKEAELKNLKTELAQRNVQIQELNTQVGELNTQVGELQETTAKQADEIQQKEETIKAQDIEINTGYLFTGTKKEMQSAGLVASGLAGLFDGSLDVSGIDMDKFAKLDKRNFDGCQFTSRKVKILSQMPASSYSLETTDEGTVLTVLDKTAFWSITPFLIIQTN